MAKHHPDLIFCRKQPGVAIGRLCEKCDGKCVICDSYVRPCTLVRICDECNYGSYQGRCVICGGPGEDTWILGFCLVVVYEMWFVECGNTFIYSCIFLLQNMHYL